jgi:hypothetical protein
MGDGKEVDYFKSVSGEQNQELMARQDDHSCAENAGRWIKSSRDALSLNYRLTILSAQRLKTDPEQTKKFGQEINTLLDVGQSSHGNVTGVGKQKAGRLPRKPKLAGSHYIDNPKTTSSDVVYLENMVVLQNN